MVRKKQTEEAQQPNPVAIKTQATDPVPLEPTEPVPDFAAPDFASNDPAETPPSNEEEKQEDTPVDAQASGPKPKITRGVLKELDFILTEAEYAEKAKRIADLHLTLDGAQLELDSAKGRFKAIEAEIDEEIDQLVQVIRAKKEKRTVEVDEVTDYATGKVVWIDPKTKEELSSRNIRHDERQMALFPETKVKEADGAPECNVCQGTGYVNDVSCEACDGKGTVPVEAGSEDTDEPADDELDDEAAESEATEPAEVAS